MIDQKTSTPSRQSERLDASFSKTYLTKRNYQGPTLLRNIRHRPESPRSDQNTFPTPHVAKMKDVTEDDILRPPDSSDEDDQPHIKSTSREGTPGSTKRKAEETEKEFQPKKRTKMAAKPTRVSKRKNPNPEPDAPPQSSANSSDLPEFLSQSSQQKKSRVAQYGKANTYNRPSSQGPKFEVPEDLPLTPKKSNGTSFKAPDRTPQSRKRTPNNKIRGIALPSSSPIEREQPTKFSIPDELSLHKSSSISTDLSNTINISESPEVMNRKRSSSTSSLSSVDSIASYELSQKQKDELENGVALQAPVPKGSVRCPLCQNVVRLSTSTPTDPTSLPLRQQQVFCHAHRILDAQAEWKSKCYPTIDWALLENEKIPKHILHLRQILYHKTPSSYLDHLETILKEAKGNQSKVRRYLAHDIVETVKPGYYGPKGAKIMANKITADMSNHLKRSLKSDKVVKAIGVSGFVSAVLLPELLQQIVMEDMKCSDEEEARKIIAESTEVGMLLHPDDDHVNRDEDE